MTKGALVLLSGGQDSTTCLAWALQHFDRVETIGFDYGQRHRAELTARKKIRRALGSGSDFVIKLDMLDALRGVPPPELGLNELPPTFIPGRNLIFLTYAAAVAYRRGLMHLVGGMCETDYSGYPDCRDDTIKAMQLAVNLGMDRRTVIHTPLMWLNKAATWKLAHDLGGDDLVELIVEVSHTCYNNNREQRHAWGYGCGTCPACKLRSKGFFAWRESAQTNGKESATIHAFPIT